MKARRLYKQVADQLLLVIDSGQYPPGARLPAERELAQTYDVSRPTIREAVIALEIAGRIEVRKGSGVYVLEHASEPASQSMDMDVGPFELTEARMLIEGEAAGLAATMITDEEIERLESLIVQMGQENELNDGKEVADRAFHITIARATRNSAIEAIVEDLWALRDRSALTSSMYNTVRLTGVKPNLDEHYAILNAMKNRDAAGARAAMRTHLSRVIDTMFEATEIEAVEKIKQRVSQDRLRYRRLSTIG